MEYYVGVRIGGATIVKVEAANSEAAEAAARKAVTDDWNEAGPLKPVDLEIIEAPITYFDKSIVAKSSGYELAADDPQFETI